MAHQERSAVWKQFLLGKRRIVAEYDRAVLHAATQPVQVHHGNVGEAAVRDWLAGFLPKRFGVTAGYIRSQGLPESHQSSHLDVIVYDQLEAPILWVEENAARSEAGLSRIIPVEHVRAVFEVKAQFTGGTVQDAAAKLMELAPLCQGLDDPSERYPRYLRANTLLGMLFFELRNASAGNIAALERFREMAFGRPFYGAIILRGEGLSGDSTALVNRTIAEEPLTQLLLEDGLLHHVSLTGTLELGGEHRGAMMQWSDLNFSRFAFDLLAVLNGTYEHGRVSSFHGIDLKGPIEPGAV